MKGAIYLLLSEHRTMVFRLYSSADYEQKRLAFFKLQKNQSRKAGLQVPVPSKVGVVQVAKDFGYKISVQLQIPSFQGARLCAKIFIFQAAKQGRRRRPLIRPAAPTPSCPPRGRLTRARFSCPSFPCLI